MEALSTLITLGIGWYLTVSFVILAYNGTVLTLLRPSTDIDLKKRLLDVFILTP